MTTTDTATHAAELTAGAWVDGYQLQAQAPVAFIRGDRTRHLDGRSVKGAWSDPWWGYDPERGWAVAKRWRSKPQTTFDYSGSYPFPLVELPARDEVITEPYEGSVAA